MARILLSIWPYAGHLYPNIALAQELRRQGHQVKFFTGAMAHAALEAEGFARFPFKQVAAGIGRIVDKAKPDRLDNWDTPETYQRLTEHYSTTFDMKGIRRGQQFKLMFHEWFLGTVPAQISDLRDIIHVWAPDILVSDPFMWGPMLVLHEADKIPVGVFSFFAGCMLPGQDIPLFGLGLQKPRSRWSRMFIRLTGVAQRLFTADLRRNASALRQQYGLAPLADSVMAHAGKMPLYLVTSAPAFDYERHDLPPSVHYVGPCLWDKSQHDPVPKWLGELDETEPVIYVTEGTAHTRDPLLLRSAAQGLAGLPVKVVMTTGRQRAPEQIVGTTAVNVRVERWIAHSDLFPKVTAIVTHGGSGTVLAALSEGLPVVIVPLQWDHMENAQRVVEAGAGICLSPNRLTPERLSAAVEEVLSTPGYRQNARRLAECFRLAGGPHHAAMLLEKFAVHNERVPSL